MATSKPDDTASSLSAHPAHARFDGFQQVLGFIAAIGLASAASCAFSLVGATSLFGDTSRQAMHDLKSSALLLSWASACFIAALAFISGGQLLNTSQIVQNVITDRCEIKRGNIVRMGIRILAWVPLWFQTAAFTLMGLSLRVFAPGTVQLATVGVLAGCVFSMGIYILCLTGEERGRGKLKQVWTLGGLLPF